MMLSNFAITAMGRSGTKFLSEIMNRSEKWTVRHEPGFAEGGNIDKAQERFNKEWYGEVNSFLRHCFLRLDVESKGVIIRHPKELLVSAWNWKQHGVDFVVNDLAPSLELLSDYCDRGYYTIRFERMVSEKAYLNDILMHFGILDASIAEKDLNTKINTSSRKDTWDDMPREIRMIAEKKLPWFAEKHGYEW